MQAEIHRYLNQLSNDHFWGNITLVFRNGRADLVRTEQSLKPTDIATTAPSALSGQTDGAQ